MQRERGKGIPVANKGVTLLEEEGAEDTQHTATFRICICILLYRSRCICYCWIQCVFFVCACVCVCVCELV